MSAEPDDQFQGEEEAEGVATVMFSEQDSQGKHPRCILLTC